jgi:amino acid adenylation domain-containing protein
MNKQRQIPARQQAIIDKCYHPTGMWDEFPADEIEKSIPARFEKMVERFPDRLAVKTTAFEFSYAQLNAYANRIAHTLLDRYGSGNHRVALLLDNDAPLLAAIHAVLKAGKAYVILDPSFPQERLRYFFKDAEAVALVSDAANTGLAQQIVHSPSQFLNLQDLPANASTQNPGVAVTPDDISMIVYTSGSTGRPKGVYNNHRNILKFISLLTNIWHISAEDRFTCARSFSVNAAIKDIFGSTLNGASIFPFHPNQYGYMALIRWIKEHRLTIHNSSVTTFYQLMQYLDDAETIASLRLLVIGAEAIRTNHLELYRQFCSVDCILSHAFAATETSGFGTRLFVDNQFEPGLSTLPCGYTEADTEIMILDEEGRSLEAGQVGEIAVKSTHLALGYWNRPDLTGERFLTDSADPTKRTYLSGDLGYLNPDGCLVHLGRKDMQSKIRGIRIDIGEIEHYLASHPGVAEAAVAVKHDPDGAEKLVAYLVAQGVVRPTVTELRSLLARTLTAQMIPTAYVWLERLPVTLQGKLDRLNLPMPGNTRPQLAVDYRAPVTPIEQNIVDIWSSVLGLAEIGIGDSFLDLGGDSLKAMRIATRIQDEFGVEIPLAELFAASTVAEMALAVTAALASETQMIISNEK